MSVVQLDYAQGTIDIEWEKETGRFYLTLQSGDNKNYSTVGIAVQPHEMARLNHVIQRELNKAKQAAK
jgi:hypothetical protein